MITCGDTAAHGPDVHLRLGHDARHGCESLPARRLGGSDLYRYMYVKNRADENRQRVPWTQTRQTRQDKKKKQKGRNNPEKEA